MISGAVEEVAEVEVEDVLAAAVVRETFKSPDDVNMVHEFSRRAMVMQNIPRCIRGPFRNALRIALEEMNARGDAVRQERGWKLFMLLPRLLLSRYARSNDPQ